MDEVPASERLYRADAQPSRTAEKTPAEAEDQHVSPPAPGPETLPSRSCAQPNPVWTWSTTTECLPKHVLRYALVARCNSVAASEDMEFQWISLQFISIRNQGSCFHFVNIASRDSVPRKWNWIELLSSHANSSDVVEFSWVSGWVWRLLWLLTCSPLDPWAGPAIEWAAEHHGTEEARPTKDQAQEEKEEKSSAKSAQIHFYLNF